MLECINPFFPQTGTPPKNIESPKSITDQLMMIYQNKRMDLYEDLFYSKSDFMFYIEVNPTTMPYLQHITAETYLKPDSVLQDFIPTGNYKYIKYYEEYKAHYNLLTNKDNEILFTKPLEIASCKYLIDSLSHDTLGALVKTMDAIISIKSKEVFNIYKQERYDFKVGPQIFYLKYDQKSKRLKIFQWFELN